MISFYSTEDPKVIFTIPEKSARKSVLFASIIDSNNMKNIQLPKTLHENGRDAKYFVNTTKLLSYIHKYLSAWNDNIDMADYIKISPIQTGDIKQVLKPIDIDFIMDYLLNEVPQYKNFDMTKYNNEVAYKRMVDICVINELITQADDCLGITSLSNKLYAYVAVQIWNTSIVDFHLAVKDPTFDKLQQEAIDEWKEAHAEKIANSLEQ